MKVIHGNAEPEAWVDRKEMARQMGIGLTTLDDMVKTGEIPAHATTTWGRRTRRFLPSRVFAATGVASPSSVVIASEEGRQIGEAA